MQPPGILILSSPSGGGKTSLARALLERRKDTGITVSHTTRPCRLGETHGIDYFFTAQQQFQKMIDDDAFVEYANVFGNFYGTSFNSINTLISSNRHAILDIDWQGARIVKQKHPTATSVFVMPPSITALKKRLQQRNQDSVETIQLRMQEAVAQISHKDEFDVTIINNDFQEAVTKLHSLIDTLTPADQLQLTSKPS